MRITSLTLSLALVVLGAGHSPATLAAAASDILKQIEDAQAETDRRKGQGDDDLDLGEVEDGAGGGEDPLAGCQQANPGRRISLLGVESDMGPSTQGVTPAARLGPNHPSKLALAKLGNEMGLYADRENATSEEQARNDAARVRRGLHDFYADVLDMSNWARSESDRLTEIPDPTGYFERAARAYVQYNYLAQQYAALYQAAEDAGRACP